MMLTWILSRRDKIHLPRNLKDSRDYTPEIVEQFLGAKGRQAKSLQDFACSAGLSQGGCSPPREKIVHYYFEKKRDWTSWQETAEER